MRKNGKSNWSNEFNFDNEGNEGKENKDKHGNFSSDIINESYEALNKFYQKENRKNKIAFKKGKPIWL